MKTKLYHLIVLILMLFAVSLGMQAQKNVQLKGNTFIVQVDSTQSQGTKTSYKYQDKTGTYDIYLSSKGKAFIWKISKKTNKKYRVYLPKITEQLNTMKDDNN